MEEGEEIQSYPSVAATGSPSPSSPSNSRVTMTVAAAPPPNSPPSEEPGQHEKAIVLALPPPQKLKSNDGGREDCWSEGATEVLIDAWGERYLELSRGNLKQMHWKEVADIVSSREEYTKTPKTDIQCKNRIDTVKKKYKSEKAKVAAGGGLSKWVFFEKLDKLIGSSAKIPANSASPGGVGGGSADFLSKVSMGIPVGIRSSLNPYRVSRVQERRQQHFQQQKQPRMVVLKNQRNRGQVDMDSEDDDEDDDVDSVDSLPPPRTGKRAIGVVHKGANSGEKRRKWDNTVKEITRAILRFGEAYEQAESAKLQHVVEMEKQRMKFAKEMELQSMQFFMKTQLEISQLKQGKKGAGISNSGNHHSKVNNSNNNNNNSDCSN
ncbi:DEAD-box ATP-dependent RNA helicase 56 [Hibiscus syriacus]|uniref:DEAD-box ATP-dependent RNA helicase 56 n=1 Tax=Hibiscus syriacus TaxID=106335 RepID=A0A6A2Z558_HIBSY|nr:trihelix transcription factor ASIL2-like [Hibiscus syriacus]KAE8686703.1 DEAD-box ATP-dependent RNA helicase 56 [Hibiscus syriacus]